MKFTIATLLATTNAINTKALVEASDQCASNNDSYDRLMKQKDYTLASSQVQSNMVNGKFEDPSFPADSSMLWNDMQSGGQVKDYQNLSAAPGITWKRPTDYKDKHVSLWGKNGVSPRVSKQGYLGDCWLLSAASALAVYPERIKAMFPGQDEYSKNGAFEVRLFVRGEPVNVIVDDRVPVRNQAPYPFINNMPSPAGAYWLVILEKAMAKLNVNYTGLNGGAIPDAFRYMTGMPTMKYYKTLTTQQVWDTVNDGLKEKYAMGAACEVSHFNMVSSHAYGVIGAVQLTGGAKNGQKLIKIRNPWGSNSYNGPWSEKNELWTADYRKQAGDYTANNIGIFWVPLESYNTFFTSLTVNMNVPSWTKTSYEGKSFKYGTKPWGQLNAWASVQNTVTQDVILDCVQNDRHLFPSNSCKSTHNPSIFHFGIFNEQVEQKGYGVCNGNGVVIKNLPAGKYQIQMKNTGGNNEGYEALQKMNTYGSKGAVTLTQAEPNTYSWVPKAKVVVQKTEVKNTKVKKTEVKKTEVKKTEVKKTVVGAQCYTQDTNGVLASVALTTLCAKNHWGYDWIYTTTEGDCAWGCFGSIKEKPKVVHVVGTQCWDTVSTGLASYDLWMKCEKAKLVTDWIYTATDKCGWGCAKK